MGVGGRRPGTGLHLFYEHLALPDLPLPEVTEHVALLLVRQVEQRVLPQHRPQVLVLLRRLLARVQERLPAGALGGKESAVGGIEHAHNNWST